MTRQDYRNYKNSTALFAPLHIHVGSGISIVGLKLYSMSDVNSLKDGNCRSMVLLILQEGLKVRRLCRRTYFVIERVGGQVRM